MTNICHRSIIIRENNLPYISDTRAMEGRRKMDPLPGRSWFRSELTSLLEGPLAFRFQATFFNVWESHCDEVSIKPTYSHIKNYIIDI